MNDMTLGSALAGGKFEMDVKTGLIRPVQTPLDAMISISIKFENYRDGELIWTEEAENLLATVGANDLLDKYLSGSAYTAAFYLGLKGTGTFVAADTMASHAGWTEVTQYSNATRPAPSWSAASAGSKAAAAITFNINGTAAVYGAFLTTNNTIGGTTGVLYSAADFASSRSVLSGDSLVVTPTATAA